MMTKELGKISSVKFGGGGYDDAMFGFSFVFEGGWGGVSDFWGTWSHWDTQCKWTKEDQANHWSTDFDRVKGIMEKAKVSDFNDLVGIPVEITFEDHCIRDWRVLTEVL